MALPPSSLPPVAALRRRALLAAVLLALLAAIAAYAASLLLPDEFQGTARVLPPALYSAPPRVAIFTNEVGMERMADQLNVRYQGDLAMSVLKSGPLLDAVVAAEKLAAHYGTANPRAARDRLLEETRISTGRDGVLAIQVTDRDSGKAAGIANAYIGALESYVVDLTNRTARTRADAISLQMTLAQQRLKASDAAFAQVQRRTGIVRQPSETTASSSNLGDLRQRLAIREAQLQAMGIYSTSTNPAYARVQAEATALRAQITAIVGGDAPGNGSGSEDDASYQRALREVRSNEEAVDGLRKQLVQAEFESVSKLAGLQVIERAVPSDVRSAPRRTLIAGTAGLVALFAVLVWFLWRLRPYRQLPPPAGPS
ncbi:MAG: hypothetical protein H7276_15540 [Caulobacter sp.]|nr:hypothetical protein [Vitreoscilla sp.]